MQIKVIISENIIFATYYKTICFRQSFSNEQEKEDVKHNAMACAFAYACSGTSNQCSIIEDNNLSSDETVFAYLERCHGNIHPINKPKSILQERKEAGEHLLDEEYYNDPY